MAKGRSILLSLVSFLVLCATSMSSGVPSAHVKATTPYPVTNTPAPDTPLKLREVWLRFHKDDLCEKVDAAFLFHESEMEVLINAGNEKNNEKLFKMLEPLNDSYRINLHSVRLQTEPDLIDIRNTPPSFWLNSRLTEYLRDSFHRPSGVVNAEFRAYSTDQATSQSPSIMYGQRMLMFARNTLEYSRKIRLYAAHLPLLARAASDPGTTSALRNQALKVCRAHAKKLEKYTKKLNGNLTRALPEVSDKSNNTTRPETPTMTNRSSVDIAIRLADEADDLSRRVFRFIYPQTHTVELDDLLNPALLRSLRTFRETTIEFRKSIG